LIDAGGTPAHPGNTVEVKWFCTVRDRQRVAVQVVKESTSSPERLHPQERAAGGDRRAIPFN